MRTLDSNRSEDMELYLQYTIGGENEEQEAFRNSYTIYDTYNTHLGKSNLNPTLCHLIVSHV